MVLSRERGCCDVLYLNDPHRPILVDERRSAMERTRGRPAAFRHGAGRSDDAHDVAVEAFLRVAPVNLESVTNRRAYLMWAVVNRVHDLRRSRERRLQRDLAAIGPISTGSPDTYLRCAPLGEFAQHGSTHCRVLLPPARQKRTRQQTWWPAMIGVFVVAPLRLLHRCHTRRRRCARCVCRLPVVERDCEFRCSRPGTCARARSRRCGSKSSPTCGGPRHRPGPRRRRDG